MKKRTRWNTVLALILALAPLGAAKSEVVEEETWFGATGEVVKTVKRTYAGSSPRVTSTWEPSWVVR